MRYILYYIRKDSSLDDLTDLNRSLFVRLFKKYEDVVSQTLTDKKLKCPELGLTLATISFLKKIEIKNENLLFEE